ncbi:MAG: hypothetical protein KKE01_02970 [Candidatus Omnitrophica bacterium]|nr:hypothetical protein [Candidatus Omnitrophota bacterium]
MLIAPYDVKAEDTAEQVFVNEDGVEASTIELKDGTKVVAFMIRENKDQLFLRNPNNSIEASLPRANVVAIRKATAREVQKQQKKLEVRAKPAPRKAVKK